MPSPVSVHLTYFLQPGLLRPHQLLPKPPQLRQISRRQSAARGRRQEAERRLQALPGRGRQTVHPVWRHRQQPLQR